YFIPNVQLTPILTIIAYGVGSLIGGIILFLLSAKIIEKVSQSTFRVEKTLEKKSIYEIISGALGLIVGLIIASLISIPIKDIPIPWIGSIISFILYIVLGYLGVSLATKMRDDLLSLSGLFKKH